MIGNQRNIIDYCNVSQVHIVESFVKAVPFLSPLMQIAQWAGMHHFQSAHVTRPKFMTRPIFRLDFITSTYI